MGSNYQELDREKVLKFYSRRDVQEAIYEAAKDKEIGVFCFFKNTNAYGFLKRPDVINSPADVLELAKQGATSFHFSEENWKDPLLLSSDMTRKEQDKLRKGWDLVIDIDTPMFEYSKVAAELIIEALKYHGIKSITCKFSGNHGFHIAVPFESFPEMVYDKEVKNLFPEGPRLIAKYIKGMIGDFLKTRLLDYSPEEEIAKNLNVELKDIETNGVFDPFKVVDIDTILISSRHLCRMPYVFNEKSGLISIPIKAEEIKDFEKEMAKPENVHQFSTFLDRSDVEKNEAQQLFTAAHDEETSETQSIYNVNNEQVKKKVEYEELAEAIPQDFFPPCIKEILKGMDDGKKRGLFILINFLGGSGYGFNAMEEIIYDWNKRNKEPLKEVYIKSQLKYAKQTGKKLPPNCASEAYYKGLNICAPDDLCKNIKNPLAYAKARYFRNKKQN